MEKIIERSKLYLEHEGKTYNSTDDLEFVLESSDSELAIIFFPNHFALQIYKWGDDDYSVIVYKWKYGDNCVKTEPVYFAPLPNEIIAPVFCG